MTTSTITASASVRAKVHHRRTRPFDYAFTHGTTMWLVDIADPNAAFPTWLKPFVSIRARDHLAEDDRPLPEKVRSFLDIEQIPWTADRVLMLAAPRSLGYVFDPLTTFFCFDADGQLEGVLAEVHNTYGKRHCYPLSTTDRSTTVDKEFYVSPFFAVEGRYDIRTKLTDDVVAVKISLTQDDEVVFVGSVRGDLEPARTARRTLWVVLRNPLPSQRVSALIRWHGIRLWLRRLPVIPRRPHQAPKRMT